MTYIAHGAGGGPEVMTVASGPVPTPAADEVLIKVEATGVNRPDVAQRSGSYPPPPGASPILGLECAGEVVALGGSVTGFKVGDKVCALTNGGAYAEYCTAPQSQTLPWPKGYDAIRAAAVPETYFTVWANLFGTPHAAGASLKPGETVLIHGGSSGIGLTAIQLAKAFGCQVLTTVGSEEKCEAVRKFGADHAINYRSHDFFEEVKRVTDGKLVDVVLDMVGGPYFNRNLRCLKLDGRLSIIAFLSGPMVPEADLRPIMVKRLNVTGSTMRPRTTAQKAEIADALRAKVWPLLEQGKAGPHIHATFPLAEAVRAHELMESSQHIGKIVLTV
ncbi:NAD(P)H-quinone oxidoreductase [Roseococcus sp. SYP-B2431]|uniref:NAD(P)H-quinone oxidoreductase n=1 Tax=Roseococcus sp. SYP-B2431 TaxID=2496640 RepID=UPI00103F3051|nr:NAD(P)H-quinone oxidoreductase [Roseococcus sp. SYP-B2431]